MGPKTKIFTFGDRALKLSSFDLSRKIKQVLISLRGRGFRAIIFENLILRYELKGKARTRSDILRVVLGLCVQCCPCEASEQKWGQKLKSTPKCFEIVIIRFVSKKQSNLEKIMSKSDEK